MPYAIKEVASERFKVVNKNTGAVKAKSTTKAKAVRQVRLLDALEEGYEPSKRVMPMKSVARKSVARKGVSKNMKAKVRADEISDAHRM